MSSADIAILQARLTSLEQENEQLRSRLQSCEQSHGVTQAPIAGLQQQEQNRHAVETAIAREQEQAAQERAAELAKANEALKRSLDQLANDRSLNSFLSHILREAVQMLDGAIAQIFLYDAAMDTLQASIGVDVQGSMLPEPGLMYGLPVSEPFPANITPVWQRLLTQRRPLAWNTQRDADEFWPGTLEWHRSRGHQEALCVAMMIGDQPLGILGLAFRDRSTELTSGEFEFVQALGQQAALAIQLTQLVEEARQAEIAEAIAREQKQAAQEQAAELAKANTALQRVIDALTAIDDLDEFVPATLRIVAQTFETENCAFYEHGDKALVYLRYWLMGDRVLRPDDLVTLDSERFSTVRRLAEGFTVPDLYLGTPVRDRARAVILDHTCGTSDPEFDQFTREHNWVMELNVPLVVDGYAEGALVIYRPARTTYTPAEIGLAEALGKQLALALQASRLATEKRSQAVETAIAREQEKAVQERVATLERVQFVLQRSAERLSMATDPKAIIVEMLRTAAEVLAPLGVEGIKLMSYQPITRTVRVKAHILNDVEQTIAGSALDGDWSVDLPSMVIPWQRIQTEDFVWGLTSDRSVLIPEVREYHETLGSRAVAYIPLRRGEETTGWIGFDLASEMSPTTEQIEMIEALSRQIVLAAEMDRLAEAAKQAAILKERNRMARDIHDTLAQSFTGIIMQLEAVKDTASIASDEMEPRLDRISDLARLGLSEARRSVQALRPQALEAASFAAALRQLLRQFTHDTPICATLTVEGASDPLPDTVEENLLRIAQEALTNAIRHGYAHTITLQLLFEPAAVHLQISDDGNGFDPHSITRAGFGLVGMQERTLHLNGQFHLASRPGQGTEITVSVPI